MCCHSVQKRRYKIFKSNEVSFILQINYIIINNRLEIHRSNVQIKYNLKKNKLLFSGNVGCSLLGIIEEQCNRPDVHFNQLPKACTSYFYHSIGGNVDYNVGFFCNRKANKGVYNYKNKRKKFLIQLYV